MPVRRLLFYSDWYVQVVKPGVKLRTRTMSTFQPPYGSVRRSPVRAIRLSEET